MPHRAIGSDNLTEAIEAALRDHLAGLPLQSRGRLIEAVAELIETRSQAERNRCVAVCRQRAELWRNTSAARSSVSLAREEARARANEAIYLADLLISGDVSDASAEVDA